MGFALGTLATDAVYAIHDDFIDDVAARWGASSVDPRRAAGERGGASTPLTQAPPLHRLEDLLRDPSLLDPPPVVLPRLAWAGRLTLLAAPEKSGKSTLAGQAVAALAMGGDFLGEPVTQGTALWLALNEPLSDVVRRLDRYGARGHVVIATEVPTGATLKGWLADSGATTLVIDTLAEFARFRVTDFNAASQWVSVLNDLRGALQVTGAAGVLLHHVSKGSGKYRDSSQIGAGVDAILEMKTPEEDKAVRLIQTRGRMTMRDFRLRFSCDQMEPRRRATMSNSVARRTPLSHGESHGDLSLVSQRQSRCGHGMSHAHVTPYMKKGGHSAVGWERVGGCATRSARLR